MITAVRGFKMLAAAVILTLGFTGCGGDDPLDDASKTYHLTVGVNPQGYGSVTLYPNKGIYDNGEKVIVMAEAEKGYDFVRWEGVSSANASVTVTMDGDKTLTAIFQPSVCGGECGSVTFQGQEYRTVAIGSQTWFAENLNYAVGNSKCYDNAPANCVKYGRLYDWETAKTACPAGWHLPNNTEWTALEDYANGRSTAGAKLKSTSGWWDGDKGASGNGTNEFGFSALPGGYRDHTEPVTFSGSGFYGYWWSATQDDAYNAYNRRMNHGDANVNRYVFGKTWLHSVRCVKD